MYYIYIEIDGWLFVWYAFQHICNCLNKLNIYIVILFQVLLYIGLSQCDCGYYLHAATV